MVLARQGQDFYLDSVAFLCGNGVGMATTCTVMGGDGDGLYKMVQERSGDRDKGMSRGTVMGLSICPHVIL